MMWASALSALPDLAIDKRLHLSWLIIWKSLLDRYQWRRKCL